MNTLKRLLLSLSIASMGFVAYVRADDAEETGFVSQAADFAQDVLDDAHDAVAIVVDGAHDVATDVVEAVENAAEEVAEEIKPLVTQYQNMVLRTLAKSFIEVGGNVVNHFSEGKTPKIISDKNDNLAKIYVDLSKIVVNTALDELMPQAAEISTLQNIVETLVPAAAGQRVSTTFKGDKGAYAALTVALTQKALSKGLFIKTEGLTKRALQVADFVLSCVDTKAVAKIANSKDIMDYNNYFQLHKGVAKLVTKQVMDAIVKKAVSDAQVTSKATREKALADFFHAVLVKPLCETGVEQAFSK